MAEIIYTLAHESSTAAVGATRTIYSEAMSLDSDIAYLLDLYDEQYPDEVDEFEDLLCGMLGICRHPAASLSDWRIERVQAIEAAGDEADRLAPEVERYVDLLL